MLSSLNSLTSLNSLILPRAIHRPQHTPPPLRGTPPTQRVGFVEGFLCQPPTQRVHIVEQMQGLRWARMRSLLNVNEQSEPERNAADAHEMCSPYNSTMRSQKSNVRALCEMKRIVRSRLASERPATASTTSLSVFSSSEEVASSNINTEASL